MSARSDMIQSTLASSPGVTFGVPDAFYGHRPIYYTDGASEQQRVTSRAWLKDPEGYSGKRADFTGWNLTAAPPSTPPWDVPQPWLLPAVATGYNSPDDIVGSWGVLEADGGLSFDVHRGGYLTPRLPGIGLPPAWMLAASPYTASDFRNLPAASTTPASPPPANTPPVSSAPRITGNANDRFLVNGVIYDGLGTVIGRTTPAPRGNNLLLLGGLAAAALYFSHARRR